MRISQFLILLPILGGLTSGCSVNEESMRRPLPEPSEMRGPGRVEPGVILVKVRAGSDDPSALAASAASASGLPDVTVERLFPGPARFEARKRAMGLDRWYAVHFDPSVPVTRAADMFSSDMVEAMDYVVIARTQEAPETWPFDDPRLPDQWHYMNFEDNMASSTGSDINLFPAWEMTTGDPSVIVAVIDSGVDVEHEDLSWNIWTNEAELNGQPGVDDDGNGYVDDIHGYNFTVNEGNGGMNGSLTPEEHGTHVAGTIAAVNNNGTGVSGIAGGDYARGLKGARVMSCQTMPGSAYIGPAFTYAADNGAVISQNSWSLEEDQWLSGGSSIMDAIQYFNMYAGTDENGVQTGPMRGGICIFAAGNESTTKGYPAMEEDVLAVASIGANYKAASYTNYGSWVDVTAPGGEASLNRNVISTIPGNTYGGMQGTSMACPHVSGVAALVVSAFGGEGFTNDNLRTILVTGVRSEELYEANPDLEGRLGSGLIDAELCLMSYGPEPPYPVTGLESVSSTSRSVTLRWTVPEDPDSGKPTTFSVYSSESSLADLNPDNPGAEVTVSEARTGMLRPGEIMEYTVTGLSPDTDYYFRVRALDNLGNASPLSEEISVTTASNTPPVLEPLDETTVTIRAYETISIAFACSDADGDELTWEVSGDTQAVHVNWTESSTLAFFIEGLKAPVTDEPATYNAVLTVSDGAEEVSCGISYTVIPNVAPEVAAVPGNLCMNMISTEPVAIDLGSYFNDTDGEPLTYRAVTAGNDGTFVLAIDGSTLNITAVRYGQDTVTVTAVDASGETAEVSFAVLCRDGSQSIDTYPNPVTDTLYIRAGSDSQGHARIASMNGATVFDEDISISAFNPAAIDMSSLPGGMYVLTVEYEGNVIQRNIAKL